MARRTELDRQAKLDWGQMSTNDFTSIDTIHKMDCEYYHRGCKEEMAFDTCEAGVTARESMCSSCGLRVRSTLSDVHAWKRRDA